MDVRDDASVHAGTDEVYERFGGIDVLVNNAGIGMRTVNPRFLTDPQPFWAVAPEGFLDVLETKVAGCFLVARDVVPRMLAAGGGRVVTISMNTQTMIRRGFVPYGPAGAAVEALARVMAADLAGGRHRQRPAAWRRHRDGNGPRRRLAADAGGAPRPGDHGSADRLARLRGGRGVHDERIVASDFDEWLARRCGPAAALTGEAQTRRALGPRGVHGEIHAPPAWFALPLQPVPVRKPSAGAASTRRR